MRAGEVVREIWSPLDTAEGTLQYCSLEAMGHRWGVSLDEWPVTMKILFENLIRQTQQGSVTASEIAALTHWRPSGGATAQFPFLPRRVVLHDYTGVPAVVDLAAMRDAVKEMGGDPAQVNPRVPADFVIDHSVQVDQFGSALAFGANVEREYERNAERYTLLRWAQQAFDRFRVVPPGTGIIHQVNMEYLASVVGVQEEAGTHYVFPESLVGTDSHTTMINGLGILGWGVGGIEAEAVILGQPLYLLTPEIVGVRVKGQLPDGATATDIVLTVTQMLRAHGVVGCFVEFAGEGLSSLSVADRATIANMSPEFGATATLFPVDDETLRYLQLSGRPRNLVDLIERYTKEQGLFRTGATPIPAFSELLELDLTTIEPSLAGPRRPQDRVALGSVRQSFRAAFPERFAADMSKKETPGEATATVTLGGAEVHLRHGAVAIAAITSCTNTSNPSVMIAAGLLAKHAVERGLHVKPSVKTSLAPGSRVVIDYLEAAGLLAYLEAMRFHLVGYGCTTCIGNSGPLAEPVAAVVADRDLVVAAVLSGNRNFEGRIHPQVQAAYLASPPLVVAYALAGTVDIDLTRDPIGEDPNGMPVYLRDLWPTSEEIARIVTESLQPEMFSETYRHVFDGDDHWRSLPASAGEQYDWDGASTYIQQPPFFKDISRQPSPIGAIMGARVLVMLGDSVTTDHISPAGTIPTISPAGQYLRERGVAPRDFNNYGTRRGNHEVMVRGTFGNIRLRNELAPGSEGGWTAYQPGGEVMRIYDAAQRYQQSGTPLMVIAGKEYGSGSSRDWAAKGQLLLGVTIVLAESFERIHRSNLVGMGMLPLQFLSGDGRKCLSLTGSETFDFAGLDDNLTPGQHVTVRVNRDTGDRHEFEAVVRLDSPIEVEYYRHGGVLPYVLRRWTSRDDRDR